MRIRSIRLLSAVLLLIACLLISCSRTEEPAPGPAPDTGSPASGEQTGRDTHGTRDNSIRVLTPSADGGTVYTCDVSTIDATNASEGYVMVNYTGTNPKVKLQITGPDQIVYSYDLHGDYEVFPLTAGDGVYTVTVSEDIADDQYATALSQEISVRLENTYGPYLYPNQYVSFTESSLAVARAKELAASADSDLDVVSAVYNYMITNFTYDYDKAASVTTGYLPVVDDVFSKNSGICFDYAAVMAAMLRSQAIPTRLEVGFMGEVYHAWVSIYIKDMGWINGIIEFDGKEWKLMDPTFASTSDSPQDFITENSKYTTKFVY
ncbi:MAG: transglutaminase-like domain-containing protein [Blautia sp.]|nr:transglutaminase-like domain-containing protein [Blautia sp.]